MRYLLLSVLMFTTSIFAQKGQIYQIYTGKGKKVSFEKMVSALGKEDVVLFGEFHNNAVGHWLQLKLTEEMGKKYDLMLGAEMFESDNQNSLSAYVEGDSTEEDFIKNTRLWNNYKTDYKPLVEYAKANKIEFIATNVPRRYASLLYKNGVQSLDTLGVQEKQWIAPLPFPYDADLPGYKKMLTLFEDHQDENMPKAQAIKDATMAYFINKNWVTGKKMIHYNGSYHSNNFEGIFWYLKHYNPVVKIGTIAMVESDDVTVRDKNNLGLANFIIVVDTKILKSF